MLPTQSAPLQQSPRALTSIRTISILSQCSRNSKIKQSLSHPITPPTDFRQFLTKRHFMDKLDPNFTSLSKECREAVKKDDKEFAQDRLLLTPHTVKTLIQRHALLLFHFIKTVGYLKICTPNLAKHVLTKQA
uniref:Uncharacterized protein n=1 Tax=Caenorhabditis japonica TaxID=281687 RepID=A0A8R1DQD0_CAEJA